MDYGFIIPAVLVIMVAVGVWIKTRKNRSTSEDIPPLLSDKLKRDDYYITKSRDRARRDTYEIPGTYKVDFKKLPTQRLPERIVKFKAGVDYPEQKKKRNRKGTEKEQS